MTEQEVRHVSDRYQQPHGGEGVRRAGGGSPVPGGYLSGDPGAGQRSGVYRPPAAQPSAVRPHETPYRTVVLSDRPQTPDGEECLIMSEAITRIDTFTPPDRAKMPQRILEDYQMIDCSLVRNTFAF